METSNNLLKERIEAIILPARKSAYKVLTDAMVDAFTEIGVAVNVLQYENPNINFKFTRPLAGLSTATLSETSKYHGMIEEWFEMQTDSKKMALLFEFLAFKQLQMAQFRTRYPNAYTKWSTEEDEKLKVYYEVGNSFEEISDAFGRNENAIKLRLVHLGYDLGNDTPTPRFRN